MIYLALMAKRKETEFDKLARLIKSEGEDIRGELGGRIDSVDGAIDSLGSRINSLEKEMREGFSGVIRRLDSIIQMQLDEHARRIKKLETTVFK